MTPLPSIEACDDQMLEALKPLALREAYVANVALSQCPDLWICRREDGRETRLGRVALTIVRAAVDRGWIAPADDRYMLTREGAAALRRARCEKSAARAGAGRSAPDGRLRDVAAAKPLLPVTNDAESPLTWLRSRTERDGRPMLSDEQFAAGERLRADLWHARMSPRVTASWSGIAIARRQRRGPPGAWIEPSEAIVAARERVVRALVAVGPEHVDILIDVLGCLKGLEDVERSAGLPARSGKRFLQRALTALARHYGYLRARDVEQEVRQRLRHWGSEDYRPSLGFYEP